MSQADQCLKCLAVREQCRWCWDGLPNGTLAADIGVRGFCLCAGFFDTCEAMVPGSVAAVGKNDCLEIDAEYLASVGEFADQTDPLIPAIAVAASLLLITVLFLKPKKRSPIIAHSDYPLLVFSFGVLVSIVSTAMHMATLSELVQDSVLVGLPGSHSDLAIAAYLIGCLGIVCVAIGLSGAMDPRGHLLIAFVPLFGVSIGMAVWGIMLLPDVFDHVSDPAASLTFARLRLVMTFVCPLPIAMLVLFGIFKLFRCWVAAIVRAQTGAPEEAESMHSTHHQSYDSEAARTQASAVRKLNDIAKVRLEREMREVKDQLRELHNQKQAVIVAQPVPEPAVAEEVATEAK